jgi:hypothetical protein
VDTDVSEEYETSAMQMEAICYPEMLAANTELQPTTAQHKDEITVPKYGNIHKST